MSFQHRCVQGLGVEKRTHPPLLLGGILLAVTLLALGTQAASADASCTQSNGQWKCSCSGKWDANVQGFDYSSLDESPAKPWQSPQTAPDLEVAGLCFVPLHQTYYFRNVNIIRTTQQNSRSILLFKEDDGPAGSRTHFWARAIVVENGGELFAYGRDYNKDNNLSWQPFGFNGGVLTIHLYGSNEASWNQDKQQFDKQNQGALCTSPLGTAGAGQTPAPCGIPQATWNSNGASKVDLPGLDGQGKQISDYFYKYGPLHGDAWCNAAGSVFDKAAGACTSGGEAGYFGNKVLAVSYGGTLVLRGYKGASFPAGADPGLDPDSSLNFAYSGNSWMRLADGNSLEVGDTSLVLEKDPNDPNGIPGRCYVSNAAPCWGVGDEIVVTTTDYLPGHSEKLTINKIDKATVTFNEKIKWPHNGLRYGGAMDRGREFTTRLPKRLQDSLAPNLLKNGAETRAAVALLSRSIRIVSEGDQAGETFDAATARTECKATQTEVPGNLGEALPPGGNKLGCYYFGAHTVVRQGFKSVQIQGVEFVQMGQGGRLGHYPVHFHMARQTPALAYVKDSSINESMTRWIVLHSTLGVTVQRNVGYKSIGHGFYLEDGTETDNKFYSNIGIFARAAVQNAQNPRRIPGILSTNEPGGFGFIHRSDSEYPSVFWITNGWNDFVGNMAAGAATCGAAYWFVPTENMGMAEVGGSPMKWSGYAAMQGPGRAGTTPLKSFYMNYATSAMHSFQTTGDAPACNGVIAAGVTGQQLFPVMKAVESIAPRVGQDPMYYPRIHNLPNRSFCDVDKGEDCSTTPKCAEYGDNLIRCMVIVLDHFTTAFHWAEGAISAVWLRPKWHLLTNSVISDVQNGGLTFITGGDYTRSSVAQGYWSLAKSSIFIGNTRDNTAYPFASNIGPFNNQSGLKCEALPGNAVPGYCVNIDEGISMPTTGFFTNQRLSNIYDGPSYQDSNAYLDIQTADCAKGYNNGCIYGSEVNLLLLKRNPGQADSPCYLPNAAIGWKQPNGFYYPPAFHSRNLFFGNVDIRHYVIDPLFGKDTAETTYVTDEKAVSDQYCTSARNIFGSNWTSIDRQTVLQDNDGSLTGLSNTEPAPPPGQPPNPLKQTFSVNDDPFFEAPVEAPECASAIDSVLPNGSRYGNSEPANACNRPVSQSPPATAKTSPYDYLSTVVSANIEEGWDRTCTDPNCYGVPLYRQYLTADEWKRWFKPDKPGTGCDQAGNQSTPECRWPMIRMAGADIGQRQTMTVNNGLYYLDTTVPEETQKKAATRVNGFRKDRKYLVFFVYAKDTTRQTYQIYVGTKFDSTNFKPARVSINVGPVQYTELTGTVAWVTPDYTQVATKGILTVTVDFRTEKSSLAPTPTNGVCHPQTFCKAAGNSCVNTLLQGNPNKDFQTENSTVCSDWAVKDLDCPLAGCYGFSFELRKDGDFATGGYHRPLPLAFPTSADDKLQGKPDWATKFERTQTDPDNNAPVAGQPHERKVDYPGRCYYQRVPFANCRH